MFQTSRIDRADRGLPSRSEGNLPTRDERQGLRKLKSASCSRKIHVIRRKDCQCCTVVGKLWVFQDHCVRRDSTSKRPLSTKGPISMLKIKTVCDTSNESKSWEHAEHYKAHPASMHREIGWKYAQPHSLEIAVTCLRTWWHMLCSCWTRCQRP